MHKLDQKHLNIITLLADVDSQAINLAFSVSENLGLCQLSANITEYSNLLYKKYGDIVLSYSSEYRIYIVTLLEKIDDAYKMNVLSELINPQVKDITNKELYEYLEKSMNTLKGEDNGK